MDDARSRGWRARVRSAASRQLPRQHAMDLLRRIAMRWRMRSVPRRFNVYMLLLFRAPAWLPNEHRVLRGKFPGLHCCAQLWYLPPTTSGRLPLGWRLNFAINLWVGSRGSTALSWALHCARAVCSCLVPALVRRVYAEVEDVPMHAHVAGNPVAADSEAAHIPTGQFTFTP